MAETTVIAETFSFNDRAEGKLDFANFETEPSDRTQKDAPTDRPTDRPTDEKGAFRDSDDACEGEIRGHGGEDESLVERESERGLS